MGRFTRKISPTERMWLAADRLCPPFFNQLVVEGTGPLDARRWRKAVDVASARNPGSRLVARGRLGFSRWEDNGACPRVRVVDGRNWSADGPEGAPFLLESTSPRRGPTCEVVLVNGDTPRVVFRSMHAVMDGRGTLNWAEDIFAVLRGEPPRGADSRLSDVELARQIRPDVRDEAPANCLAPTGAARGKQGGVTWRRVFLPGRVSNLMPRIAVLLAQRARQLAQESGGGAVRFAVPVDMRPHGRVARSTGNLTGMLHLEVGETETAETVRAAVRRGLDAKDFAVLAKNVWALQHLPLSALLGIGKAAVAQAHRQSRYAATAVLSNFGVLPLESLKAEGFEARRAFFIPPGSDGCPLFLVLAGVPGGVELVASVPERLASDGRLDSLLQDLKDSLLHAGESAA